MKLIFMVIFAIVTAFAGPKPKVAAEISTAKTLAIITRFGPIGNGGYTPDLRRARSQVQQILEKWGRYKMVDDPLKADLIMLLTEGHYGSIATGSAYTTGSYTTFNAHDVAILGDIIEIYKGGVLPDQNASPLWVQFERGGYTWPAKRAANKFRKDVDASHK